MEFALVLLGVAALAVAVGYLVHRRWIVQAAAVIGAGVVAIDIATRDLASGGHDWTLPVAVGEMLIVALVAVGLACGIALWRRRTQHRT